MTLTDPEFGFKKYEGDWKCISISYSDVANTLTQRFGIDAGIGDLATQVGDPFISTGAGVSAERFYFPRIVNPEDYQIPDASLIPVGQTWIKRMQDNGDATFDVMIEKTVANELLEGHSFVEAGTYSEVSDTTMNGPARCFAGNPVPGATQISMPTEGQIIRIENVPNEDGTFRSTVTQRDAKAFRVPALNAELDYFTWRSDYGWGGRMIVAENQTLAQFYLDLAAINPSGMSEFVVSPSVQINDYGLYNYTISARV